MIVFFICPLDKSNSLFLYIIICVGYYSLYRIFKTKEDNDPKHDKKLKVIEPKKEDTEHKRHNDMYKKIHNDKYSDPHK
ncbi:MAG: hypothetical protein GY714_02410 [Desulfobacterales bacterium]|nr:hypothetical protein [Desulfobacterales bacterium]